MMKNRFAGKAAAAVMAAALIGTASCVPAGGRSVLGIAFKAYADEATTTANFDESTGVLTLSGDVVAGDVQKWKRNPAVTKVVCDDGAKLPANCYSLFRLFYAAEIDLTNADTSGVTSMESMFYECQYLKTVKLSGIDTSNVTSMSGMFNYCSALESIDLSGLDTSNVTKMDWMFNSCKSLKTLDVTGFDTRKVNNVNSMFSGCSGLTSIDLSGFDTSAVINMGYLFDGCSGLTSVDLSTFDTSNVTFMYGMFLKCSSLTTLDVSCLNTSKVTNMTHMFSKCPNLTSIKLGSMDTSSVEHMEYMFNGCSSLRSVDLSRFDTSSATDMGYMFQNCSSLEELDLSSFDTSSVVSMNGMFTGCSSLRSLDLSSFDTSKVKTMTNMFHTCKVLEYADLSGFDTSSVTDMRTIFFGCDALEPSIAFISGQNAVLDGYIGANIYLRPCDNLAKAVVSGPNGDIVYTELDKLKQENGDYKFSYPLNADQYDSKLTLKAYDKDGRQLIICKGQNVLSSRSQAETTLNGYLAALKETSQYDEDKELAAVVDALENFCRASKNYFCNSGYTITGIDGINAESASAFKPEFGDDVKLSPLLSSRLTVRLYTSGENILIDNDPDIKPKESKYGENYEISGFSANKLGEKHYINIDGTEYEFTPLAYVYRVLNNDSASSALKDMAKATLVYAQAAEKYFD